MRRERERARRREKERDTWRVVVMDGEWGRRVGSGAGEWGRGWGRGVGQDVVYNASFDGLQKVAVKSRKSVDEFFKYEAMEEKLEDIKGALKVAATGDGPDLPVSSIPGSEAPGPQATTEQSKDLEGLVVGELTRAGVQDEELCKKFTTLAERRYESFVTLLTGGGSTEIQLSEAIMQTPAGKSTGRVLIYLDHKLNGESRPAPHIRASPPPPRCKKKVCRCWLLLRRVPATSVGG